MSITSEDEGKSKAVMCDIEVTPSGFSSYHEETGAEFTNDDPATADAVVNHFTNFIDCVRSRNRQDLHADILEGHLSSSISHLGNIACRLKRPLQFDPDREVFVNDPEADSYLTRDYRAPFVVPETV